MASKLRPHERYSAKEATALLGITKQDLDTLIEPEHSVLCDNGRHISGYGRAMLVYRRRDIDALRGDPRVLEMAAAKAMADEAAKEARRLADIEKQRQYDLTMTDGDFEMWVSPLLQGDVRKFHDICNAKNIRSGDVLRDAILKFLADNSVTA